MHDGNGRPPRYHLDARWPGGKTCKQLAATAREAAQDAGVSALLTARGYADRQAHDAGQRAHLAEQDARTSRGTLDELRRHLSAVQQQLADRKTQALAAEHAAREHQHAVTALTRQAEHDAAALTTMTDKSEQATVQNAQLSEQLHQARQQGDAAAAESAELARILSDARAAAEQHAATAEAHLAAFTAALAATGRSTPGPM